MVRQYPQPRCFQLGAKQARIPGQSSCKQGTECITPVTGQPHRTHATAAKTSCDVRWLSTLAAAHVTIYMAKLLGSRLVEEVNMPQENSSSSSSLLLVDGPAYSLVALRLL